MAKAIRLRPEVRKFAEAMELNLRRHDSTKGGSEGWHEMSISYLYRRSKEELMELASSILEESPSVLNEAADCANFLMMLVDVCLMSGGYTERGVPDV